MEQWQNINRCYYCHDKCVLLVDLVIHCMENHANYVHVLRFRNHNPNLMNEWIKVSFSNSGRTKSYARIPTRTVANTQTFEGGEEPMDSLCLLLITHYTEIYWKKKETHIFNFKLSDLYWEHVLSQYQHLKPKNTNNYIYVSFVDNTLHRCHAQACIDCSRRKPEFKTNHLRRLQIAE